MIANSTRDKLLFRSDYKCEYCHRVLLNAAWPESWQIEHIKPRSNGGTDHINNLAVACPRCNLNKREATEGKDYVTGRYTRLFNPRKDQWVNHFGVVAGQIVGRSVIGRATAKLLFKRTEQQLPQDLCWWPLKDLKDERLYRFLNHQRARRLGNKFDDLHRAFGDIPFLKNISDRDSKLAQFAAHLLLAESLYTRSNVDDVKDAFDIVAAAWRIKGIDTSRQAELLNVTSIVLQQLATILVLEGKHSEARLAQNRAFRAFENRLELLGGGDNREILRLRNLRNKYNPGELKRPSKARVSSAIQEAQSGNLGALSYAADAVVAQDHIIPETELVLEAMNNILLSIGYGQDFDYGYNIVVRRRWWSLLASLDTHIDLDLLEHDLQFWKSVDMQNEIRELAVSLQGLLNRRRNKSIKDMLFLVKANCTRLSPGR